MRDPRVIAQQFERCKAIEQSLFDRLPADAFDTDDWRDRPKAREWERALTLPGLKHLGFSVQRSLLAVASPT